MSEPIFDFYIQQSTASYPQIQHRHCRISRVRVLRFPGAFVNDLILYQIQYQVDGVWVTLPTREPLDNGWFGFARKPSALESDRVLRMCHQHFLRHALTGTIQINIREYLTMYKRESIYPIQLTQSDGVPVMYWDSMLVQGLELSDVGTYTPAQYGSVKVRQRWQTHQPQPKEPFLSGVLLNLPLDSFTLTTLQQRLQRAVRHPGIFARGKPLHTARLEIFHTTQPGG